MLGSLQTFFNPSSPQAHPKQEWVQGFSTADSATSLFMPADVSTASLIYAVPTIPGMPSCNVIVTWHVPHSLGTYFAAVGSNAGLIDRSNEIQALHAGLGNPNPNAGYGSISKTLTLTGNDNSLMGDWGGVDGAERRFNELFHKIHTIHSSMIRTSHIEVIRCSGITLPSGGISDLLTYDQDRMHYNMDLKMFRNRRPLSIKFTDTKHNLYMNRIMNYRTLVQQTMSDKFVNVFNSFPMSSITNELGRDSNRFDLIPPFGDLRIFVCDQKGHIKYWHEFQSCTISKFPAFQTLDFESNNSHNYTVEFDYRNWDVCVPVTDDTDSTINPELRYR